MSSGAVVVTSVKSHGAELPGNHELPGIGVEFSYESSEKNKQYTFLTTEHLSSSKT